MNDRNDLENTEEETSEQLKAASSIHASRDEASAEEQLDAAREQELSEEEAEEEVRESSRQERERTRSRRSRNARLTGKELLETELLDLTTSATPSLRAQLKGKIAISFEGASGGYLFDWSSDTAALTPFSQEEGADGADCKLHLDERVLVDVTQGELNPQIAMLSDKIQVSGKHSLAVYFFNLFDD